VTSVFRLKGNDCRVGAIINGTECSVDCGTFPKISGTIVRDEDKYDRFVKNDSGELGELYDVDVAHRFDLEMRGVVFSDGADNVAGLKAKY